jgi:bacteriocin-like protein
VIRGVSHEPFLLVVLQRRKKSASVLRRRKVAVRWIRRSIKRPMYCVSPSGTLTNGSIRTEQDGKDVRQYRGHANRQERVSSFLLAPMHSPPADTPLVSTSCNEKSRKDLIMSEQAKQTPQELKQSVLDRLDAARKAVEELSEDELEAIVGGANILDTQNRMMGHTAGSSDDPALMPGRRGTLPASRRSFASTAALSDDPGLMGSLDTPTRGASIGTMAIGHG